MYCCCCPVAKLCLTLCDPMDCSTPGFPVFHYLLELLKLMSIKMVMPSNRLILCPPLLLLPSVFPSIRVFSNELVLRIRWPKHWSFSFSSSPPNEYSGWFPLGLTGLIFLQSQGLSRVLSNTTVWKHQFCGAQPSYGPTLTFVHDYWKHHSFDYYINTVVLSQSCAGDSGMSLLYTRSMRLWEVK